MIIYCIFANRGGLTRVAEGMIAMLPTIPKDLPFKLVVISGEEHHSSDSRFQSIKLDGEFTLDKKQIDHVQEQIERSVDLKDVKWIIGEDMVLPFWEKWSFPFIYDVHLLQRPLFAELSALPGISLLDQYLDPPPYVMLRASMLKILKNEAQWLARASGFIVNSYNSYTYLQSLYSEEISGKPIFKLPVESALKKSGAPEVASKTKELFNYGRFHPQKGIHFLFGEDWTDLPLTMRGGRPEILRSKLMDFAKKKKHYSFTLEL